jgi:hypothetical protein
MNKLAALPTHLGHWQRQENAIGSFRQAWAKKPISSHLSAAQRRAQLVREFAETQRLQREHLAKAKAEIDRYMKQ